jgi:transcription initiation factor TFIIH subunit 3
MDAVDASGHYEIYNTEDIPSLAAIIIDTNPRAWAAIGKQLPISTAIANILVYVNAHLAFNNANQVAILAAHTNRAVWLYPRRPDNQDAAELRKGQQAEDVEMTDADGDGSSNKKGKQRDLNGSSYTHSANKYPQFAEIDSSVLVSLRDLIQTTTEEDLAETTTQISGALTLALCHINKISISTVASHKLDSASAGPPGTSAVPPATVASNSGLAGLHARILVISVSDSAPSQYIPTMNAVFAAAHAHIGIDCLALHGNATFLQQASFITRGTFMRAKAPQGLLSYLMFGFASAANPPTSDSNSTAVGPKAKRAQDAAGGMNGLSGNAKLGAIGPGGELLLRAAADEVDFRAACFCHRRVVDQGFVCSICLSIFCEVLPDATCLTCGTHLQLGNYGSKPAVVPPAGGAGRKKVSA